MSDLKPGQIYEDNDGFQWQVGETGKLHLLIGDGSRAIDAEDLEEIERLYGPLTLMEGPEAKIEDEKWEAARDDPVNHPKHYTSHPSGVECIEITEHMNFCLGNAIKYIWRAGLKSDDPIQDLRKAMFYLEREVKRIEASRRNQ